MFCNFVSCLKSDVANMQLIKISNRFFLRALKDKQSKELLGRKIVLNLAKLSAQTPQSR